MLHGDVGLHGERKCPQITCKVHEQARVIEEQDQRVERRRGAVLGDDGDDGERREDVRVVQQHEGSIASADACVDWVELDCCGLAARPAAVLAAVERRASRSPQHGRMTTDTDGLSFPDAATRRVRASE